MTIFDREPNDWVDLQNMVGQMFFELGCDVEVSKKVQNVRGAKEIDVYVRDTKSQPPSIYLCECKYWKRAVPQEVVHAFRTVMQDTGAHRGFIVSNSGFQAGAFEAVRNTNIDLVTFPQLQEIFFDRWREHMSEHYAPFDKRLFPYWDYPGKMPKFKWDQSHVERQQKLVQVYQPMTMLGPLSKMTGYRQKFPMVLSAIDDLGRINGELRIETYRQFFDFIESNKDLALYHFQVLYGEIEPNRIKGEYNPRA